MIIFTCSFVTFRKWSDNHFYESAISPQWRTSPFAITVENRFGIAPISNVRSGISTEPEKFTRASWVSTVDQGQTPHISSCFHVRIEAVRSSQWLAEPDAGCTTAVNILSLPVRSGYISKWSSTRTTPHISQTMQDCTIIFIPPHERWTQSQTQKAGAAVTGNFLS